MKIFINDQLVDKSEAKISVFDHGLLRGDGLFERLRFYEGCLFKIDLHLERLFSSARAMLMKLPWTKADIIDAIKATCRANDLYSGELAIIVTRGIGNLDVSAESCERPQLIIIADATPVISADLYKKGIRMLTSSQRQLPADVFPAQVKSLNYAKNVLTKAEVTHLGYDDAVILNAQGYVTEAIAANIFMVKNGELLTPPVWSGALPGITRAAVMQLSTSLHIPTREALITRYDLWNADECFVTGSIKEIVGVVEIDGRVIGNGKPGTMTERLAKAFHLMSKVDGEKFELNETAPVFKATA